MKKRWTKKELVVWGLGVCGGDKGWVDTEDVGVFLFRKHPGIFGLRKYREYPNVDVARIQLADAKRDKGTDDPARVIQDTDERKREARRRGDEKRVVSKDPQWRLNELGRDWFHRNRDAIDIFVSRAASLGARRAAGGKQITTAKISEAVTKRVRARKSFAVFSTTKSPAELSILDFFAVFNVDAHTPSPIFQRERTRTLSALDDGSTEADYATRLSEQFGDRYRTYYDELLASGS